jgi:hypothetical protein
MAILNDQYTIGINLDVNGASVSMLKEFNEKITSLSRRFTTITKNITKFNSSLDKTRGLLTDITGIMTKFSIAINTGLDSAAVSASNLNKELRTTMRMGNASGHGGNGFGRRLGHHLSREVGGGLGGIFATAFAPEVILPLAAGAYLGKSGWEASSNWQQTVAQLQAQGVGSPQFISQAISQAQNSNIAGVSKLDYLKAINDSLVITKDPSAALYIAPTLAAMGAGNSMLMGGDSAKYTTNQNYELVRSAEIMSGSRSGKGVTAALNQIEQTMALEGFKVSTHDIYGFFKRNAAIASMMNPDALAAAMIGIQQATGSSWGVMNRTFVTSLLRGQNFRTGKKSMAVMQSMGLYDSNKDIKDSSLLTQNAALWIEQVWMPALSKAGFKTPQQQKMESLKLVPGTMGNYLSQTIGNISKSEAAIQDYPNAFNISSVLQKGLKTPQGSMAQLSASWTDFATALGKFSTPLVMAGIKTLSALLEGLATILNFIGGQGKTNLANNFGKLGLPDYGAKVIAQGSTASSGSPTNVNLHVDGKKLLTWFWDSTNTASNRPNPMGNSTIGNLNFAMPSNNTAPGSIF